MTEKEFDNAFTTAGGWFIPTYLEQILSDGKTTAELAQTIYQDGTDRDISGTKSRVSAVRRLISDGGGTVERALKKVVNSATITRQNPKAAIKARELLIKIESGGLKI